MSDTWYRDPPTLPPFEDGFGQLWTLDGRCLNPPPTETPPELAWLDEWPEELQWEALKAAAAMDLADEYRRHVEGGCDGC